MKGLLNPDGTLNLNSGFSGPLDLMGWDVRLDSMRGPVLTRQNRGAPEAESAWAILPPWCKRNRSHVVYLEQTGKGQPLMAGLTVARFGLKWQERAPFRGQQEKRKQQ